MDIKEWSKKYTGNIFDIKAAKNAISDFISALSGKKLMLYGMGVVGIRTVEVLNEIGIIPDYLVDRDDKRAEALKDYSIVTPDKINWDEMDDVCIIASMNRNYLPELREIISSFGYTGEVYDGQYIYASLRSAKCTRDVENGIMRDSIYCHDCVVLDNVCIPRRKSFMAQYGKANETGSDKMWMIGYILGQYCTLKCKHCCEAIPYYPADQRSFADKETVIKDIKYMAAACKFLTTIEFIGGEPFLHPQLKNILEEVIKIPNAGKIHIFTNGTAVPTDDLCELLSDDRFEVTISNYQITLDDRMQENVRTTIAKLREYNVNYMEGRRQGWLDFASFDLVCDDEEKVKERYRNCFIHTCNRLFNGVLYHCPHEYAGALLGHFDSNADILHIYDYSTEELAKKLDEYKDKEFFESCKYCKLPYDAEPVVSGIQL